VANAIGLQASASDFSKPISTITEGLSKTLAHEHHSYLRERAPTAQRIIDKMPHNFELIGLLSLLFPKARIIHCRRDAIDNCVSCYVL
ncbi:MAG: sulfotransferase, partial [Mesorhizobium sp.]